MLHLAEDVNEGGVRSVQTAVRAVGRDDAGLSPSSSPRGGSQRRENPSLLEAFCVRVSRVCSPSPPPTSCLFGSGGAPRALQPPAVSAAPQRHRRSGRRGRRPWHERCGLGGAWHERCVGVGHHAVAKADPCVPSYARPFGPRVRQRNCSPERTRNGARRQRARNGARQCVQSDARQRARRRVVAQQRAGRRAGLGAARQRARQLA